MKALIKKGTESNPVWGFIRFCSKGWEIIPNQIRPTVFSDLLSLDDVDGLSHDSATKQGFVLVTININIQES
jgi:hypothetical protein